MSTTVTNTQNHDNTINFMYFVHNFPYQFIFKVWQGAIAQHLESKFIMYCNKYEKSNFGLMAWFMELDRENQTKFLTWVNENYKSFSNLKL